MGNYFAQSMMVCCCAGFFNPNGEGSKVRRPRTADSHPASSRALPPAGAPPSLKPPAHTLTYPCHGAVRRRSTTRRWAWRRARRRPRSRKRGRRSRSNSTRISSLSEASQRRPRCAPPSSKSIGCVVVVVAFDCRARGPRRELRRSTQHKRYICSSIYPTPAATHDPRMTR